ncbi:type I restriction enzyme HsdR N-terminal domain-containing protein [Rhizobium rhizosphaerae]|nr:type I restriction enzyme HsdR N-terminal domain-containing protein [Xaviernesmea rhizosphaerae]
MIATQEVLENIYDFNEAEVRFHILDPLIRKLGYHNGNEVYLKLEEKLRYPYYYIGRKNPKKDLPIGFPDYRAGLKGARGSFIVEAKAANVDISVQDVEQAHSYAAHAEVGANYFVLSNGLETLVFQTLSGPNHAPIIHLKISELDDRFHELENVLNPINLARLCKVNYDLKLKLGDGLRSAVEIRSGEYQMAAWDYRIYVDGLDFTAQLKPNFSKLDEQLETLRRNFELRVGEGNLFRDADGRIKAFIKFTGATKNNEESMKLIGLDRMGFSTTEQFLSHDPDGPTVFESSNEYMIAKGTKIPPMFGAALPIDLDVNIDVYVKTRMYLEGNQIKGDYLALSAYSMQIPGTRQLRLEVDLSGTANLRLMV